MKHNLEVTVRKFYFGDGLRVMGLNQWTNGGRYMKLDTEIIDHKHTHKYSLQAINYKHEDIAIRKI